MVGDYTKKAYMKDLGGRKRHRAADFEKAEGDKSGGWRNSQVQALASRIIEEKRRSSEMRRHREEGKEHVKDGPGARQ